MWLQKQESIYRSAAPEEPDYSHPEAMPCGLEGRVEKLKDKTPTPSHRYSRMTVFYPLYSELSRHALAENSIPQHTDNEGPAAQRPSIA